MTAAPLQLEDLLALAETLRVAGYSIGTQQYIAAHELLITLASRGQLPPDPARWRTLLGPLFCSSKQEQLEFVQHFQDWLARRPHLQAPSTAAQSDAPGSTATSEVRRPAFKRQSWPLGRLKAELPAWLRQAWQRPTVKAALLALLLLAGTALYLSAKTTRTLPGKVIDSKTGQGIAGAKVSFKDGSANTDEQGEFRLPYNIRNFDQLWRRRSATAKVSRDGYGLGDSETVLLHAPTYQPIKLDRLADIPLKPVTNVPIDVLPPTPTPTPEGPGPVPINQYLWPTFVPLVLYALWLLWRWWRRKLVANKLQTSGTPKLRQLKLKADGPKLFDSPAFRRAVVELRRHRHVAADDLDVPATIRATIRRGGLFTPSFGRRRTLPEYLLLIDRASLHDEQARAGEALAERLDEGDVGIAWYYFQGDARTCRAPGPFAPTVTLSELAARHPEHRLLVFGDGAGFFDPFSGAAQRWLEQFDQWPERALVTPAAPQRWDYREETLREHDFLVLPANGEGFEVLTAWLNTGLTLEPRRSATAPYPELMADRPKRWLERSAPPPETVTKLLAQVKTYLGEDGWFWLQACAVYPQLTWELTLYLGARLLGVTAGSPAKGDWAERVLQLVRLPWFRYGALPDWLRGELVARFTPPQAARVRGVIAELLQHVLTKPGAAIPLEMATEPAPEPRRWRRWLAAAAARLAAWWRLQRLYRLLQGQAPENQMRDYVLLSFLAGRQLKPLSVQAPKLWERLLFQHGLRAWGGNPVTVGVVALGVAAACFWWFYWEPMRRLPNRLFDESYLAGSYKPFATPTRDPNVSLTPTPTPVVTPTVRPTAKPAVMPATSQGGPGEVGNPDVAAAPLEAPKGEWPVVKVDGGYRVEMPNGVTLNLVSVAGGEFMMGWDKSDYDFEKPAHRVRLSGFNLGKYEVTQEQWLAVMGGKNPSNFQGDKLPVEQVLWDEAREFCQRLTAKTGVPFDLPTEAQWEYAARAGWPGEYGFNGGASQLGQYAWYVENSGNKTHPVGQKQPNRWGLYDMHGNVWEWCRDWYGDSYYAELQKQGTAVNPQGPNKGSTRVLRGGSWFSGSVSARAVFRYHGTHPAVRGDNVGFRVVVVSPPS